MSSISAIHWHGHFESLIDSCTSQNPTSPAGPGPNITACMGLVKVGTVLTLTRVPAVNSSWTFWKKRNEWKGLIEPMTPQFLYFTGLYPNHKLTLEPVSHFLFPVSTFHIIHSPLSESGHCRLPSVIHWEWSQAGIPQDLPDRVRMERQKRTLAKLAHASQCSSFMPNTKSL